MKLVNSLKIFYFLSLLNITSVFINADATAVQISTTDIFGNFSAWGFDESLSAQITDEATYASAWSTFATIVSPFVETARSDLGKSLSTEQLATLNLSEAANKSAILDVVAQFQVFAKYLASFGADANKSFDNIAQDLTTPLQSYDSVYGICYGLRLFFESAISKGAVVDPATNKNIFGISAFSDDLKNDLFKALIILRSLLFSTYYSFDLNTAGGLAQAKSFYFATATVTLSFERKGLLAKGFNIDNIITSSSAVPLEISKPLSIILTKGSLSKFVSIDKTGQIKAFDDFQYSDDQIFSVLYSPTTTVFYLKSPSLGKLVGGQFSSKVVGSDGIVGSIAFQDGISASTASLTTTLLALFKGVWGTDYNPATDKLETRGLSPLQLALKTVFLNGTILSKMTALKTAIQSLTMLSATDLSILGSSLTAMLEPLKSNLVELNIFDQNLQLFFDIVSLIKTKFSSLWTADSAGIIIKQFWGQKVDPAAGNQAELSNFILSSLPTGIAPAVKSILFNKIEEVRAFITYSAKVQNLIARFGNSLTTPTQLYLFFLNIESLVQTSISDQTTGLITSVGTLAEAFPEDIQALRTKILTPLDYKDVYKNLNQEEKTIFEDRKKAIIAYLDSVILVEEYFQDLQNMVDKKKSLFSTEESTLFLKKLDRILTFRSSAKNVTNLISNISGLINNVRYNQMKGQEADLDAKMISIGINAQPGIFKTKKEALILLAKNIGPSNVNDLLNKIDEIIALKTEANKNDLEELYNFLLGGELLNKEIIFFDQNKVISNKLKDSAKKLIQPIPFTQRVISFRLFLQNNVLSGFITSPPGQKQVLDEAKFRNDLLTPFFEKTEWMIFEKENAKTEDLQNILALIGYARRNQLALAMDLDLAFGNNAIPSMFQGKKVSTALETIETQLQVPAAGLQTISAKTNLLIAKIQALQSNNVDGARSVVEIEIPRLLMQRLDATPDDLKSLLALLELARWNTNLNNYTFSTGFPAPAQKDQKIGAIIDASFLPYLKTSTTLVEYLDSLKNIQNNQPITVDQQNVFIVRTKKMIPLLLQIQNESQFADIEAFFKEAKFNYMSKYASDLDMFLNKLTESKNIWVAGKQESSIPDFASLLNNFKNKFATLNDLNYKILLDQLNLDLGQLLDAKKYALLSDLKSLSDFVSDNAFLTNPVMIYRNGKDVLKKNLSLINDPISFLSHYQSIQNLIRIIITEKTSTTAADGSSQSVAAVTSTTDYRVLILREKLSILAKSNADIYTNKINIQDIFILLDSMNVLNQDAARSQILATLSSVDGSFDSFDTLKQKLRSANLNQELIMLSFSEKIVKLTDLLGSINSPNNAVIFYEYALAMLDKKVEATPADINNYVGILSKAYYSSNFATLYGTAKTVTNGNDLLNDLSTKITTTVNNLDRTNWLLDILALQSLTQVQQDLIMRILGDLLRFAATDSTGNKQLMTLSTILQKSSYTTLVNQQAKLKPVITSLQEIAGKASLVKVSPEVLALQQKIDTLEPYELKTYISGLQDFVTKRLDLSDDDNNQLIATLLTLQNKRVFTSQKTQPFGTTNGKAFSNDEFVATLLSTLKSPASFLERFDNLQAFYENLRTNGVLNNDKSIFMKKVQKILEVKAENLIRYEDDARYDKVFALINLLTEAAYDTLREIQSDILDSVNQLTQFRESAKQKLSPMLSTRMSLLKSKLNNIQSFEQAQSFLTDLQGIARDKVQGTKLMINDFVSWLQSKSVTGNPTLYRANLVDATSKLALDLADINSIGLANRYDELQRIIKQYSIFSDELKVEFFEKLWFLVDNFIVAANSANKPISPTKQQIQDLILFAKQNLFTSPNDVYLKNSLGGNATKVTVLISQGTQSQKDKYQEILDAWNSSVGALSLVAVITSFASRLNNLHVTYDGTQPFKYTFLGINDDNVRKFIEELKSLISNRVDGIKGDIDELSTIVSSTGLKTNASIFSLFGNFDVLTQMQADIAKPITFSDRAINFKDFVAKVIFVTDVLTPEQKNIFVDKSILIFEERWKAPPEGFDLKVLQDLINMVMIKKFNVTTDKSAVDRLTIIVRDMLVPAQAPVVAKINFDFMIDSKTIRDAFDKLSATTFDSFIKLITEVSTRRVNAIYENDAQINQAEVLRDWLLSNEVMLDEPVYSKEGNQAKIKAVADLLNAPITYDDLYKNMYNFVVSNQSFDTNVKDLCLKKINKFVRMKPQAFKENYDLSKVIQLFVFIQNNRLSFDAAAKTIIDSKIADLKSQNIGDVSFDAQMNALKSIYFSGKNPSSPGFSLTFDSVNTANMFVDTLQKLVNNKADSLKDELDLLNQILATNIVINKDEIFKNQVLRDRVSDISSKLIVQPNFSELANNLQNIINNKTSFLDEEKIRFKKKLRRIVDSRSQGYESNFDMKGLSDWVNYALSNQMVGDNDVSVMYQALSIKPKGSTTQVYLTFGDKLQAKKNEFGLFTNSSSDKSKVEAWLNSLQDLINLRVDGYIYTNSASGPGVEDDSMIQDLKSFLNETVRYNFFIYRKPTPDMPTIEQKVDNYILQLNATITYSDLVSNLESFANLIAMFNSDTKNLLETKVSRIVARRGEATADQKGKVKGLLKFIRLNKFQPTVEGDFLLEYVKQIDVVDSNAPASTGGINNSGFNDTILRGAVESLEGEDSSITIDNISSRVEIDNAGTLQRVGIVTTAFASQISFKTNPSFQTYLSRARIATNSLLSKLQQKLTDSQKLELSSKLSNFAAMAI